MKKTKHLVIVLIVIVVLMALVPLFALKGAEFGDRMMPGALWWRKLPEAMNPGSHLC